MNVPLILEGRCSIFMYSVSVKIEIMHVSLRPEIHKANRHTVMLSSPHPDSSEGTTVPPYEYGLLIGEKLLSRLFSAFAYIFVVLP